MIEYNLIIAKSGGQVNAKIGPLSMSKITVERLVHWFIFSVLIALLPILFNTIGLLLDGEPITLGALFGKGELFLIAVAISGRGVGELVVNETRLEKPGVTTSGTRRPNAERITIGMSVIIVAVASFGFAHILAKIRSEVPLDLAAVAWLSIIIFLFALATSSFCIVLKEN